MRFVREGGKEAYVPVFSNYEDTNAKLYPFKLVRGKDKTGKEFEIFVRVTHGVTKPDVTVCKFCHERKEVMRDIGVQPLLSKDCRKDCLTCHSVSGRLKDQSRKQQAEKERIHSTLLRTSARR